MIVQEIRPRKPYPSKEAVEMALHNMESTMPKAKTVKAKNLIDGSAMRKLDEGGFIENLYKWHPGGMKLV